MSIKRFKLSLYLGLALVTYSWSVYALPPVNADEPRGHGVPTQIGNTSQTPPTGAVAHEHGHAGTNEGAMAAAGCDVNAFATSNSSTLISQIETQGAACVNQLFTASSSTQYYAFSSDNMYAVANHTSSLVGSYTGTGSADLQAFYLYLRAGYFAEYYNDSITFISWVTPAVKNAIDAFVNSGYFYTNNSSHGIVLQEVITLMDSSVQQHVYLHVVKEWLDRWSQSYADVSNMRKAVNKIFTIIWRGQWNPDFVTVVGNDTTLVSRLRSFTLKTWMIGSDAEYMAANAALELGRLKTYSGTAIQSSVDAALNDIFSTYQMVGYGDSVWLKAANTADSFGNCADYNICGYRSQVETQVLSQHYTCSSTIRIRSQNLTSLQQSSACSTMGAEETYFHNKLQTGNSPIPGDNNTQLQINIFDSDLDYSKYAAAIFQIDTNNGGMYLEGDPSVPGNVPNFIAYEATYAEPDHYIWNLEHEYVHYLDGRFNLYGNFGTPTAAVVWWAEGLAEYISRQEDNQKAYDTIHDGTTYGLSTIFATTYDGFDQDRIYQWGYLAVRFMFERHLSEVLAMRNETRAGNWSAYQTRVNNWASSYSNEFTSWLQTVQPSGGSSSGGSSGGSSSGGSSSGGSSSGGALQNGVSATTAATEGQYDKYYIDVPSGATDLQVQITGGSGDADLYLRHGAEPTDNTYDCRPWQTGNEESCTESNPSGGRWYINVKAYNTFSGVTLTATYIGGSSSSGGSSSGGSSSGGSSSGGSSSGGSSSGGSSSGGSSSGGSSSGGSSSGGGLQNGVSVSAAAASGEYDKYYIDIPSGATDLQVQITGGSGDADLYLRYGAEPTDNTYDCRPWQNGNEESCSEPNPSAGRWYINLKAYNTFSGVTLTATYNDGNSSGNGINDTCATEGPSSGSAMTSGDAICLPDGNYSTSIQYRYIYVPANTSKITIRTQHGTGDGNLYYNATTWASSSAYSQSSSASGNTETIVVQNPTSGYRYMSVTGQQSGMTLQVDLE